MYLTYTICSQYHNTTKKAYCVTYLDNILQLSLYYLGIILCTLRTQYAPNIIILPRKPIECITYILSSNYQNATNAAYYVHYLHNMLQYHNNTKVAYCVAYLHIMLPFYLYYVGSILCTLPTQYAPNTCIIILPR